MKYLMFVCVDEDLATPEAMKDMPGDTMAWVDEMDGRGVRLQGNRLQEISTATTVRVRAGEVVLADGPFAETKELVAGYDILECADLDEAIEVAGKHPVARIGSIEVRPAQRDIERRPGPIPRNRRCGASHPGMRRWSPRDRCSSRSR